MFVDEIVPDLHAYLPTEAVRWGVQGKPGLSRTFTFDYFSTQFDRRVTQNESVPPSQIEAELF